MQINSVTFNKEEQQEIFNKLVELFDVREASYGKGHTVEFQLNELVEIEATLVSDIESVTDENNQTTIKEQSASLTKFKIFCNGDEVEVNDWCLDYEIGKYYRI